MSGVCAVRYAAPRSLPDCFFPVVPAERKRGPGPILSAVMPALVAGIHVLAALQDQKTWMAGTSPAMTPSVAAPAFLRFNCQTALANAPPPCFFAAPGAPSLSPPERGFLPSPPPTEGDGAPGGATIVLCVPRSLSRTPAPPGAPSRRSPSGAGPRFSGVV